MHIDNASPEQLEAQLQDAQQLYTQLKQTGLNLDLTRGKPSAQQLALSDALDGILGGDYTTAGGVDVRNYGGLDGLPELKALFAQVLGCAGDDILIGGNSSLSLMYLVMTQAFEHGLAGPAWREQGPVKFLCPAPGYDRHFAICEHLGIEMLPVAMNDNGPDMDQVEALVAQDASVKGIWCVPRFSNPTGCVYSDDTVARIAALPQRAGDGFLVLWDNAYAVHTLAPDAPALAPISAAAEKLGTQDGIVQFGSTSKVTFAGAGVAYLATGAGNLAKLADELSFQTIGPDKVNQLRHLRFLQSPEQIAAHMVGHAALIAPRFDCVLQTLQRELADSGMGEWSHPQGGYFISFDTRPGLAKQVVAMAAEIGVKLTPAGATFPYGNDPQDSNIRLAPTFPSLEDVQAAVDAFVVCVKLASLRQKLG